MIVEMPYQALIDALLEEGRTKSEAILRKAEVEAERMLSETKQQSEILEHEVDSLIQRDRSAQRTAMLSRTALSGRHILLQYKQEVLDTIWREAKEKAMSLTGQDRAQILSVLLDEGLKVLSSQSPRVVIEYRERPYLENILKERGIPFEAVHQDDLLLGVKLESDEEILINTIVSRLAKAKPELMIKLNRLLFGDQQATVALGGVGGISKSGTIPLVSGV